LLALSASPVEEAHDAAAGSAHAASVAKAPRRQRRRRHRLRDLATPLVENRDPTYLDVARRQPRPASPLPSQVQLRFVIVQGTDSAAMGSRGHGKSAKAAGRSKRQGHRKS
jgi:hypothetical protein